MKLQRSPTAVEMTIDETMIVVDPDSTQMLTLNAVGGIVWSALASPIEINGIVQACVERFPQVPRSQIAEDVAAFVKAAQDLGVVRVVSQE